MSDTGNHVGPIVFADETARSQLVEAGEVVTFRASQRTTGETWWRKSRTGTKCGDVTVEEIGAVDPRDDDALKPHRELSGFTSVAAWRDAMQELNGGVPDEGYLFRVTAAEQKVATDGGIDHVQRVEDALEEIDHLKYVEVSETPYPAADVRVEVADRMENALVNNGQFAQFHGAGYVGHYVEFDEKLIDLRYTGADTDSDSELATDGGHRPPCDAVANVDPTPPTEEGFDLERRVCPNCRLYFDTGADSDSVFCSDACRQRHERGELIADGGLYEKYDVRKDGERVEDCFVLEPADDPAAREALLAYADATDDDELAADLREWVDRLHDDADLVGDGGEGSTADRHAKVNVIAPDGGVEDAVKVQFDTEQPLGIDPSAWMSEGYFGSEYSLELVYLHIDGEHYTGGEDEELVTDGGERKAVIERELPNDNADETARVVEQLETDLEKLAEETDEEYVFVRLEPLTKDKHEANEALREVVRNRSTGADDD